MDYFLKRNGLILSPKSKAWRFTSSLTWLDMGKFINPIWSIYQFFFPQRSFVHACLVSCMRSEPIVMAALPFWHRIGGFVYICSVPGEMLWYPALYIYKFFSLVKCWFCCDTLSHVLCFLLFLLPHSFPLSCWLPFAGLLPSPIATLLFIYCV